MADDSGYGPDEALQRALDAELSDAEDFVDDLQTERTKATEYYHMTSADLDAEEGRSSANSSDVYDTVNFLLPSLIRTFFGVERLVEFLPNSAEDEETAKQATDYITKVVIQQDNDGFLTFWNAFKDALIRKTGVFKWWWDESVSIETHEYTDLDEMQYQALAGDPEVEIVEEEYRSVTAFYDVTAKHSRRKGVARFVAVPPEELLVSRNARTLEDSSIVGHRCIKTVGELVALGYDRDEILQYAGSEDDFAEAEAKEARNPFHEHQGVERTDDSAKLVLYVESYIHYDMDGDGIGELLKVCSVGPDHKIIRVYPASEVQLSTLCPDPEPHTAIGSSAVDKVLETQRIKTQIVRDVLDSLGESIVPRNGVVEGQVNVDDVLNKELGAPIRMRAPGMVQPFTVPFVGKDALPVLQYVDEQREARTGASKASMGLDAGALQSSTMKAVDATMQAAQGRVELIARLFAETGVKKLFKGLLRLQVENQDRERMVKLRGKWTRVDPRSWNAEMDVMVDELGLSGASPEERLAALNAIAQKQEQILQTLGPINPLADISKYRETLSRMAALAGFKDTTAFFGEITPQTLEQMRQAQSEEKPDPNTILAQAEAEKAKAQAAKVEIEAQLEQAKLLMEDDRERDKMEADMMLRAAEIQARYNTSVDTAMIKEAMARKRDAMGNNGQLR